MNRRFPPPRSLLYLQCQLFQLPRKIIGTGNSHNIKPTSLFQNKIWRVREKRNPYEKSSTRFVRKTKPPKFSPGGELLFRNFQFRRIIMSYGSVFVHHSITQSVRVVITNDHAPNTPLPCHPPFIRPLITKAHVWLNGSHPRSQ